MMQYSAQHRNRIFVRGYGKHSQKLYHAKESATGAFKTPLKREIQKTAKATGDFIGIKIANRI